MRDHSCCRDRFWGPACIIAQLQLINVHEARSVSSLTRKARRISLLLLINLSTVAAYEEFLPYIDQALTEPFTSKDQRRSTAMSQNLMDTEAGGEQTQSESYIL